MQLAIGNTAYDICGHPTNYAHNPYLNLLGRWDTDWYLKVADGYVNTPLSQGQSTYGFFPLYSLCMKFFGWPFHSNYIGGVIASNFFLLIAAVYLFSLSMHFYNNRRIATLSVIVLFFFPGSYLFSGVFSESLFLATTIGSIYFFEKDKYLLSGIAGFLAALSRPFGVLLIIPLLIRYFYKHQLRLKKELLWLALIPMGMISFFYYGYLTTGDFLIYVHAKQTGWFTTVGFPLTVLVDSGLHWPKDGFIRFNAWYAVFTLVTLIALARYAPFYLLIWALLLVLAPLSNGSVVIVCMPRYISVCFPFMMMLAAYAHNNKAGKLLVALLAILNFILAGFYALGYQFAA